MVVFILENVRPSLRGELSRWLFEVKAGVFTGKVSALVRDELWQLIQQKLGKGSNGLVVIIKLIIGMRLTQLIRRYLWLMPVFMLFASLP